MRPRFWRRISDTAEMLKISHSVFALPFALASGALAMRVEGGWSWGKTGWIVFCAVFARTAAMAQNRLVDAELDARNPRTSKRALVTGRVSRRFVLGLVVLSSALFVYGSYRLNFLCFVLSPLALTVLLAYPFAKRFTVLCHFWLGVVLGLSPVGAWLAVRGAFVEMATPVLLGAAVTLWTAGFDIIYACQDAEHDRAEDLCSLPARLGVRRSLRLSSLLHASCFLLLVAVDGVNPHVGWLYRAGLAAVGALLVYEHSIVSPADLSRVNVAFFTLNGTVSLLMGGTVIADTLL